MELKTLKSEQFQNILDICLQEYGDLEYVFTLLEDNQGLIADAPYELYDSTQSSHHELFRYLDIAFEALPYNTNVHVRKNYLTEEESKKTVNFYLENKVKIATDNN
ncbi:hypothetical protein [Aureibacter tunicatorum]|uniref:Uncharacterized protein n=1 Tax=Aureibacter tunicatorum TaxID=866807 RepID=A0AAE4BVA9_9BACT|nr:hypothetical protein [Aureibacter tunicatorum]MDR6241885.1 hypothetical protein [Aureibacter tunicatorum]BDD07492.1 hypothetical protein AUTU_49750 [Aureibacter tunicatorum]